MDTTPTQRDTCRWPDCDRDDKMSRGLCSMHYQRAAKTKDWVAPWETWTRAHRVFVYTDEQCLQPDCDEPVHARGFCLPHYGRDQYERHMARKTRCIWPGCDRPDWNRNFCTAHFSRASSVDNFDAPWLTWVTSRPYRGKHTECRWPDCGSEEVHGRGLCSLHYRQATEVEDYDTPWIAWAVWTTPSDCVVCGAKTNNRTNAYCSTACNMKAWKAKNREQYLALNREHTRRRRALKLATTTEAFTDADIRAFYGDECYLCNRQIDFTLPFPDPDSPSVDHIVPLSKGGTHTLENCAMTCYRCNQEKNANLTDLRPVPLVK